MEVHIHNTLKCPKCGAEHMSTGKVTHNRKGINSGDFSVCGECVTILRVLQVDNKLQLKVATNSEIGILAIHQPSLLKTIMQSVVIIKTLKGKRGGT